MNVVGGLFHGIFPKESPHVGVPQNADWRFAYCNSAAILFKGGVDGRVDGVRITSAWDGIRMNSGMVLENSWFTHVRDDILENDLNETGVFKDNLADGAFQGISSQSGTVDGSKNSMSVLGNVIKVRSYPYKANERPDVQYFGAFFKYDKNAPKTLIHNNIIAVEPDAFVQGGSVNTFTEQWANSWAKISECSNNLLLWMPNKGDYSSLLAQVTKNIPSCFKVVTGAQAKEIYAKAKQNWINCHPKVARTVDDEDSDFSRCRANEWGGYSYPD